MRQNSYCSMVRFYPARFGRFEHGREFQDNVIMRYNKIPGTELNVSAVALGTWVFGGDNWGGSDETLCAQTVSAALESGINFIDTAPAYGWGRAETIVGNAIKGKRDKVVIATKCGLKKEGKSITICLKPEAVRRELEDSLKRLGTDYIDIYQLHWPDKNTPLEETLGEMRKFSEEGKIRHIGVSNFDLPLLEKARAICRIAAIQNEYSFLKRDAEKKILPHCAAHGVGFLAYGCLGGGILSGKYVAEPVFSRSDARSFFYRYYRGEGFEKASKAALFFRSAAEKSGVRPAQAAINWTIQRAGVTAAIAGARTPEQAAMNARSADMELPAFSEAGT